MALTKLKISVNDDGLSINGTNYPSKKGANSAVWSHFVPDVKDKPTLSEGRESTRSCTAVGMDHLQWRVREPPLVATDCGGGIGCVQSWVWKGKVDGDSLRLVEDFAAYECE